MKALFLHCKSNFLKTPIIFPSLFDTPLKFEFDSKTSCHTNSNSNRKHQDTPSYPPSHIPAKELVPSYRYSIQNRVPSHQEPHVWHTSQHTHIKIEKKPIIEKNKSQNLNLNNFPTFQPDTELQQSSLLRKTKGQKICI